MNGYRQHRALTWLAVASVLGGAGQSLSGSAGALLAMRIGGGAAVAGLPQTALVIGSAGSAVVLSRLATRRGRAPALATGAGTAAIGSALVIVGAAVESLPMVLVGNVLLGAGTTAVMLGRYAAADLAGEGGRSAAMGRVLAATTVGAVAGPNLLAPTDSLARAINLPALAGPYVVAGVVFACAAVVLMRGFAPGHAGDAAAPYPVAAPPATSWTRKAMAGLGVLGVTNLVMVGVMTMAPVQMRGAGTGLAVIGLVVSVHIAGMFVPSPLSAWLTQRAGAPTAAMVAAVVLSGACAAAAVSRSTGAMAATMLLLGIGWNIALLAGSALLTADASAAVRPGREGWGEVGMGAAASGGGIASGLVMSASGYPALASFGAIVAAFVLPAAWIARQRAESDNLGDRNACGSGAGTAAHRGGRPVVGG
jgi:MFS family permease